MAYILGYIFADGCLMYIGKKTRISSCDRRHLEKVSHVLKSSYPLEVNRRKNRKRLNYNITISSKKVYFDLIRLGLIPRKSKIVKFPHVPKKYFFHFLRGYLDGDGSIYYDRPHIDRGDKKYIRLNTCFICGSYKFLDVMQKIISKRLNIQQQKLSKNHTAFKLRYSSRDSLKLLKQIYNDRNALYLNRKHDKYLNYVSDN